MAITTAQINGAQMSQALKSILTAVNDTTASDTDISASLVGLEEKEVLRLLKAGSATRVSISARNCNPAFEKLALDQAGV